MITVPTLTKTTAMFRLADSRMPTTRIAVTARTARNAGRLKTAVTCGKASGLTPASPSAGASVLSNSHRPWYCAITSPGVPVSCGGRWTPKSWSRLTKFALHPEATVAALKAYSRIRSQPMIQAKNLAERRVAVGVGRAGDRDHRGELGVAEAGEGAPEPGEDEREDDRRPGELGRRRAGDDEDAGPDDGADPERDEVERAERPLQLALAFGLAQNLVERFGRKQFGSHLAADHRRGVPRRDNSL